MKSDAVTLSKYWPIICSDYLGWWSIWPWNEWLVLLNRTWHLLSSRHYIFEAIVALLMLSATCKSHFPSESWAQTSMSQPIWMISNKFKLYSLTARKEWSLLFACTCLYFYAIVPSMPLNYENTSLSLAYHIFNMELLHQLFYYL